MGIVILQIRHFALEYTRHHIEETSRTGGAFIVHSEVFQAASFANAKHLGILTANIDYRFRGGEKHAGAFRVARKLGKRHVGPIEQIAAVPGRAGIGDVLDENTRLCKRGANRRLRPIRAGT